MALASLEGITLAALAERLTAGLDLAGILGETPVLVLHVAQDGPSPLYATPADGDVPSFATSETSALELGVDAPRPGDVLRSALVVPVTPSNRNLHEDRVLLGRANSNDIRLCSTLVSKVHCHLRLNHAEQWVVEDEGSSNGTLLNGIRLEPGEAYRVRPSDTLVLSDVVAVFLDAEGLVDLCELVTTRPS